ncbi:taurine catabolism dioxygenase TauD [Seiridium cupressi]
MAAEREAISSALLDGLLGSAALDSMASDIPVILGKSSQILKIIYRYRLKQDEMAPNCLDEGYLKHLATIYSHVKVKSPIKLVLPAFPFKSPNRGVKVLGKLPDKGEEYSLAHLNGLCLAIEDIYPPGAKLIIVSDGLVYNDLLGILDMEVWAYGEALRAMAHTKDFDHIAFARINDIIHLDLPETMDVMTYVAHVGTYRSSLMEKFSLPGWDVSKEILNDEDTLLTYRGYIKFLETDLADTYSPVDGRSVKAFKRGIKCIARQMLCRGQAFAHAVRESFPDHLRLSIHSSTGISKLSISLLPTDSSFTTPWHCAVAFALDGTLTSSHRVTFDADPKYELVTDSQGRPSHYIEKATMDLLDWSDFNATIMAEPIYPCGWLIRPTRGTQVRPGNVHARNLRVLAQHNSPVILRGFNVKDIHELAAQAYGLGTPILRTFWSVSGVKDRDMDSQGMNDTISAEWRPFHYDGIYETKNIHHDREDGSEELDSPHFQVMAYAGSPSKIGYALFAASSRLLKYLPTTLPLERLQQLTWSLEIPSWDSPQSQSLKLIETHPSTGKSILRYHEPLSKSKTASNTITVNIEGVDEVTSAAICSTLDSLLHDRRVCYWHAWEKGDLLVSDNLAMLYAETDSTGKGDNGLFVRHVD